MFGRRGCRAAENKGWQGQGQSSGRRASAHVVLRTHGALKPRKKVKPPQEPFQSGWAKEDVPPCDAPVRGRLSRSRRSRPRGPSPVQEPLSCDTLLVLTSGQGLWRTRMYKISDWHAEQFTVSIDFKGVKCRDVKVPSCCPCYC